MTMSKINIKYLTDGALETLRKGTDAVTQKLIENPNDSSWLNDFVSGELYVTKTLEIESFTLEMPKNDKDRETDLKNSLLLYERLKHLPMSVLSDERFWCWVNFEIGYKAALKYMPIEDGKSVFKDHWLFTQGNRRGLFFGVLSRCFFRVESSIDPQNKDDCFILTRFVIENPLRFRELSWRSYSSEKAIVRGVLKAEKRIKDDFSTFEETGKFYGEIAKYISKLGSVMLLDVMTEKDIEILVYEKGKELIMAELLYDAQKIHA